MKLRTIIESLREDDEEPRYYPTRTSDDMMLNIFNILKDVADRTVGWMQVHNYITEGNIPKSVFNEFKEKYEINNVDDFKKLCAAVQKRARKIATANRNELEKQVRDFNREAMWHDLQMKANNQL